MGENSSEGEPSEASSSYGVNIYKWCHPAKNFSQKTKAFRRITARDNKTDASFEVAIHLAATILALK